MSLWKRIVDLQPKIQSGYHLYFGPKLADGGFESRCNEIIPIKQGLAPK